MLLPILLNLDVTGHELGLRVMDIVKVTDQHRSAVRHLTDEGPE